MSHRVVHVKDNVPGAVYIGRAMPRQGLKASKWANPHKIKSQHPGTDTERRVTAILSFEGDIWEGHKRYLLAELPELRGLPLACWCRHDGVAPTPDTTCHGDILVGILNSFTDDELHALAEPEKED